MKFTIKLPTDLKEMSVEALLINEWLVPKKQRQFLRTKRHLFINGDIANFSHQVEGDDQITVIFDSEDFPAQSLSFGDQILGRSLILYEEDRKSTRLNSSH